MTAYNMTVVEYRECAMTVELDLNKSAVRWSTPALFSNSRIKNKQKHSGLFATSILWSY